MTRNNEVRVNGDTVDEIAENDIDLSMLGASTISWTIDVRSCASSKTGNCEDFMHLQIVRCCLF